MPRVWKPLKLVESTSTHRRRGFPCQIPRPLVKLLESVAISMSLAPPLSAAPTSPLKPPETCSDWLNTIHLPGQATRPVNTSTGRAYRLEYLNLIVCGNSGAGRQESGSRLGRGACGERRDDCQYRGWTRVVEWEDVEVNSLSVGVQQLNRW